MHKKHVIISAVVQHDRCNKYISFYTVCRNVFKFKVDEPPVQLNMLNLGLSVILLRVAEVVAKRKCGNRDMGAVARIGDPFNEGKPSSGSRP